MVGADRLAAILEELFDVHGDRQTLKLAAALRQELRVLSGTGVDPTLLVLQLSGAVSHSARADDTTRLSVSCQSSLITNRVSTFLAQLHLRCVVAIMACCHGLHVADNCCSWLLDDHRCGLLLICDEAQRRWTLESCHSLGPISLHLLSLLNKAFFGTAAGASAARSTFP